MRRNRPGKAARALLIVENVSLARDHRLRKQAQALASAGISVTVICRADPANGDYANGIRLLQYPAPPDAQSKAGFLLEYAASTAFATLYTCTAAIRPGFDVVQISGSPDIGFVFALPFKLLGKRFLFDQRDVAPETYVARYDRTGDLVHRVLLWCERMSYRSADHVLVVNESLRQVARRRGRVPDARLTVVGNGPTLCSVRPRNQVPALRAGRDHMVVWNGVMGPQDRVALSLRAISAVMHGQDPPSCRFVFLGDGEARPAAMRLADELGLADFVDFPGWVKQDEAFDYLATADVGLEPNLEPYVSPVKVMEYMAFGLPTVAFDIDETRRLAGGAADLVPPGDIDAFAAAIKRLLQDPARRSALGQVGRQIVESSVAWDHQSEKYLATYQALLNR
jgi:glycosyltransferase involved in cell wall biosynthesis